MFPRKLIHFLEWIGGGLLCLLLVATPWMWGTTQPWSVRLMNFGSFLAAGLLAGCAIYRLFRKRRDSDAEPKNRPDAYWKYSFLLLNLLVLGFCALALYNARATFSVPGQTFTYFDEYNRSLPTTYDANATRQTLINWAATFCAFWSLRYWILRGWHSTQNNATAGLFRNRRLHIVLWALALNAFLISLLGILQRLSGTTNLLWFRKGYSLDPLASFGPFAYRGNAVEYINILWPLALGLWWILSRERRRSRGTRRMFTDGPELLLIPGVIVMVAAAFATVSRGGVIIAAATLIASLLVLLVQKKNSKSAWIGSAATFFSVALLVFFLGVEKMIHRFRDRSLQTMSGRTQIFDNSRKIAGDFPIYGTGPGAFSSVYHLYRDSTKQPWHAWVHDDWLETRVTMGWVGFSLVILNLLFLFAWIFSPGRTPVHYPFTALATIGLLGCLLKAKFDFPMQTYSIFYTFVCVSAILTTVSPFRK